MTEPGLSRSAPWWLLCCLLAGCAARPELSVPHVDETRAAVLIVRGYLESAKLHRWKDCQGPPELLEVINCATPWPLSVATFVIDEPIVGTPTRSRLRVHFAYSYLWPELKVGHRYQYLAALISDGSSNELKGVAPVARTTEGAWALPITLERGPDAFPCSIYKVEPEPLRFREPRPRQSLGDRSDDQELVDALKEDDSFTVERGYAYANKGVPLKHVPAAYDGTSAATVSGECH
jgi:hypothetical protein